MTTNALKAELATLEGDIPPATAGELYGIDAESFSLSTDGNVVRLLANRTIVGEWPSRAAFRLDLATARVLADMVDDWETLSPDERAEALGAGRLFAPICPDGSDVVFQTKTVESCCTTHEHLRIICADSGEILFRDTMTD